MARDRPRVLIFGASGQVGSALPAAFGEAVDLQLVGRDVADFSQPQSLRALVRDWRPDVIVNAAAYTAVDRAESEPDLAMCVNGTAPGVLAQAAAAVGALLVHYSTDYVFDGTKPDPYSESDAPAPLSVYGRTKREGELAVAAGCARHLIFRTSWVISAHGHNFVKTMLRLGAERDTLRVVADQHGAPTHAAFIAASTAHVVQVLLGAPPEDHRWGTYHLAAAGETTWHGIAVYVIRKAATLGFPLRVTPETVVRISTADYPTPARRPFNSRMNLAKARTTFGIVTPHWQEGVDQVLDALRPRRTT